MAKLKRKHLSLRIIDHVAKARKKPKGSEPRKSAAKALKWYHKRMKVKGTTSASQGVRIRSKAV